MLIEAALFLNIDTSIKPEMDQLEITRSKFQYNWWEEPARPEDYRDEGMEQLFRKLLETMEKQPLEPLNKVIERTCRSLV